MTKIHNLKIESKYLEAKLAGHKLFEIRENDRNYKVGDVVVYENAYGEKYYFSISFLTDYKQKPNYVVFGEIRNSKELIRKLEKQ